MFYYYGRKKQIAGLYPQPEHEKIVEPFSGSAAYSLYGDNWKNEVTLIDSSDICISIWDFLQQASYRDIKDLPDISPGETINDFKYLSNAEKWLIGFHINLGSASPKLKATKASRWRAGKQYIMDSLHKIKHWNIIKGDYRDSPNIEATWFIDPPYQTAGKYYQGEQPDYPLLAEWIETRKGQIIACEGEGATYLPFVPLQTAVNNGGLNKGKRKQELVYIKDRKAKFT